MKCLVTGANGFIGAHLVRYLLDAGHAVRGVCSLEPVESSAGKRLEYIRVTRSAVDSASWQEACRNVEVIFHLAGRAHRGNEASPSAQAVYFRDNLEMTRALAEAALKAQVRRFVFASSATVYGTASAPGEAFREDSPPHPNDVYAQSKRAAEVFLLSDDMQPLEPVIIRLPLVYGAGVKGNMAMLMQLAHMPLPLAGIDNLRSFINIPNCVDFLHTAACHPDASGRILLASDQEDVSTPDLIRALARASGKTARLFPVPSKLLKMVCTLLGQKAKFEKLAGNFQIDPTASATLLAWSPKVGLAEGIAEMCAQKG